MLDYFVVENGKVDSVLKFPNKSKSKFFAEYDRIMEENRDIFDYAIVFSKEIVSSK